MRLSEQEAKVLYSIELKADFSVPRIARSTRLKPHVVRHALFRLGEKGIIKKSPFINLPALGYTMHNIFFSLGSSNATQKQAILAAIAKEPNVLWLAELGGDYQYALEVTTKTLTQVQELLFRISKKFGAVFHHKTVSSQFAVHLFSRGYLAPKLLRNSIRLSLTRSENAVKVDELDDRILQALALGGGISDREVARTLGVSSSTLAHRITRLQKEGVLLGDFYYVNSAMFGVESFKILVFAQSIHPEVSKKLILFCQEHPHIVHLVECFGSWDFTIEVEVANPRQASSIAQELYEHFGDSILTTRILSKFQDLKLQLYPG